MSTPRFPRTRLYRDLARLEAEVRAWSRAYEQAAQATLNPRRESRLFLLSYELEHLATLLHAAADQAGNVYRVRLHGDR